jgi:hypothetical protein
MIEALTAPRRPRVADTTGKPRGFLFHHMDIAIRGTLTDEHGNMMHSSIVLSNHGPFDISVSIGQGPSIELSNEQAAELVRAVRFLTVDN